MVECEVMKLYKYSIRYKCGEVDEYTVILVSDNMKDLIDLIAEREMIDPINSAAKWFEIEDFILIMKEDGKWYHLFDINAQDLAIKFGYDVQEEYWECRFKNDAPESVKYDYETMQKFISDIEEMHKENEWAKTFAAGGVLGDALYNSQYVMDKIREMKRKKTMHDAQELDAGINIIKKIVKGEMKE